MAVAQEVDTGIPSLYSYCTAQHCVELACTALHCDAMCCKLTCTMAVAPISKEMSSGNLAVLLAATLTYCVHTSQPGASTPVFVFESSHYPSREAVVCISETIIISETKLLLVKQNYY